MTPPPSRMSYTSYFPLFISEFRSTSPLWFLTAPLPLKSHFFGVLSSPPPSHKKKRSLNVSDILFYFIGFVVPFIIAYIENIAWYEFYLRLLKVSLTSERYLKFVSPSGHVMFCLCYRYRWNFHIKHKEPVARLSGKLSCNWLTMLVTMTTPISSHVKDKNSIFTARDEDMIF